MGFWRSNKGPDWVKKLQSVGAVLTNMPPPQDWAASKAINEAILKITKNFANDIKELDKGAAFLFLPNGETDENTRASIDLIRSWHIRNSAPSLAALCIRALESWRMEPPPDLMQAILVAAILGEVEHNAFYHNNFHFKEMVVQLIRLIAAQNDIYKGTARIFEVHRAGLLLAAGCAHDLGHDGRGNTIKGVFHQGRLERRSFDIAAEYFMAAGYQDDAGINAIKTLILSTDVSPLKDPANPVSQMKAAYRFHYMNERGKLENLNLDPDLAPLQKDQCLSMMAMILHEADIATSAGLDYEVTKFETARLKKEIGADDARPHDVLDFLNDVCQRRMTSDAAQRLYAANMARIYALAERDVGQGDQPYQAAEYCEFMVGGSGQSDKTIN